MDRHPKTGLHYIHVVPPEWGPFVDVRATMTAVANRTLWMSVIHPGRFLGMMDASPERQDPNVMFIDWSNTNPIVPEKSKRKCLIAVVYLESSGDGAKMLKSHVAHWEAFKKNAHLYDATLVHSPMKVRRIKKHGIPTYLYPLGWDSEAAGLPRFDTRKSRGYVFYGSMAGKRELVFPFLKDKLGDRLQFVSGTFGRSLQGVLDESKASLHIAHSDVDSFPQWRAWQAVSTSAALVTEEANIWPLEAGKHCVVIDRVTLQNANESTSRLIDILDNTDLLGIARKCHEEIGGKFTAEKCIENYLVPASRSMLESRRNAESNSEESGSGSEGQSSDPSSSNGDDQLRSPAVRDD